MWTSSDFAKSAARRNGQQGGLFQAVFKELFKLSEWDLPCSIVVEIDMVGARDNHQFFLLAADRVKRIFGEITGVRLLPVTISVGIAISPA
ncbi:hypothetical protein STW0522ENT51_19740 [Enterobacter kobei]|nr:hypothetical protein STW0522ENT51_19740 [Enterobacter kobei]